MKKIIGLILSIAFIVNSFSVIAFADDSGWTISPDGIITNCSFDKVAKKQGDHYIITIPKSIGAVPVKGLGTEWLPLEYEVMPNTEVYIPESITYMEDGALHNGPITYPSELPIYHLVKGSYADKYISSNESFSELASLGYGLRVVYEKTIDQADVTSETTSAKTDEDITEDTTEAITESSETTTAQTKSAEYIYNETDPVPELPVSELDNVTDADSAAKSVQSALNSVADKNATALDNISLYAEEAIARVATLNAKGNEIVIDDALIADTADKANEAYSAVNNVIGSYAKRNIRKNIRIVVDNKEPVAIEKKNLTSDIDMVTLVTPYSSVRFKADDVTDVDLSEAGTNKVSVKFDKIDSTTKVNVSFPGITSEGYKAVLNENNEAVGGKYDPVAKELSAKINESGVYSVAENEKNFTDIKNKSAEMQAAIKLLASKGIISGTSEQEFSPDSSISRAEVAAIILRTISKLDPNADSGFVDVQKTDWFYGVAGSSKNAGIITGYEDNTFRGKVVIPKVQIVSVAARVLKEEMAYKDISNAETILSGAYTDSAAIAQWARGDVALATDANMVIRRTDNQFVGTDKLTRGDAAIILKRLFDKIW